MATVPAATAITAAGANVTTPATAAALSQTIGNNGKMMIVVKNASASSINATVTARKVVPDGGGDLTVSNRVVAVPANATMLIGPLPMDIFNDANNEVTLAISAITSVTIQAYTFN